MAEKYKLAIVVMGDDDTMKDCPDNTICLMTYDSRTDFSGMNINGEYAAMPGSASDMLSCITAMHICCRKAITSLVNEGLMSAGDDDSLNDFIDDGDDND